MTSTNTSSHDVVDDTNKSNNNNLVTPKATKASSSSAMLDVKSCSTKALVDTLIEHRGLDTATKLLQESVQLVGKLKKEEEEGKVAAVATSSSLPDIVSTKIAELGDMIVSQPIETSFTTPRIGKYNIQWYKTGFVATKANDSSNLKFIIDSKFISHVIIFPKPEDCKLLIKNDNTSINQKKLSGRFVFIRLHRPMVLLPNEISKKPIEQFCFALPSDKKLGPVMPSGMNDTINNNNDDDDDSALPSIVTINQVWNDIIQQSLGQYGATFVIIDPKTDKSNVDSYTFRSYQPHDQSTTSGNMPFVNCYHGVNDGVLFPLQAGLLFYKPLLFIPRYQLHSISCGRGSGGGSGGGGGQSSSRYVDMIIQTQNSDDDVLETIEFTNIQREETVVLNAYIYKILIPAMQQDVNTNKTNKDDDDDEAVVLAEAVVDDEDGDDDDDDGEAEAVQADSEDDDEDSDEDFEHDEHSDEDSDEEDNSDSDDAEVKIVRDEFATSLAKEKQKRKNESNNHDSSTEFEDDEHNECNRIKSRISKRLRRNKE